MSTTAWTTVIRIPFLPESLETGPRSAAFDASETFVNIGLKVKLYIADSMWLETEVTLMFQSHDSSRHLYLNHYAHGLYYLPMTHHKAN